MGHLAGTVSSPFYDVLDAALDITGAQMGNVQLLDRHGLAIVAHRGFDAPFLNFFSNAGRGSAACSEAWRRGKQVPVEDVTKSPLFAGSRALEVLLSAGVRAVQSTPLIDRTGTVIGMLSTHFSRPHQFDYPELRLLDFLARKTTAFIERDDATRKLTLKERQLERITDNVTTPMAQYSHDLRYTFVNRACAELIGRPADQIVGRSIEEVLGEEALDAIRPYVVRVLAGERVDFDAEIPFPRTGPRYMTVSYVPDIEASVVRGWFSGMTDITDRRRSQEQLTHLACKLTEEQHHNHNIVTTLAHEFRNPLSAIHSSVAVLKHASDDSRMAKPSLEILDRQVSRLIHLVDKLLDVTQLSKVAQEKIAS